MWEMNCGEVRCCLLEMDGSPYSISQQRAVSAPPSENGRLKIKENPRTSDSNSILLFGIELNEYLAAQCCSRGIEGFGGSRCLFPLSHFLRETFDKRHMLGD